jgi:hypothetical protein
MIPGERREPAARSGKTSIPGALGRTISSPAAAPAAMRRKLFSGAARIVFGLLVFSILVTAILLRPPKWLSDFDQSFYLTIAYDLAHHGVFSNGMFDAVDSTVATPPPGTFFAPLYPWLIVGAAKIDDRFAAAVDCSVEANHKVRDGAECEVYARPMHLLHAAFLALGVLAIALAAELIFSSSAVFWLAGILATLALLPDADLFSFVMTESISFLLYSIAALALVLALKAPRIRNVVLAGGLFGLLCLTRASFVVLAPLGVGLIVVNGRWLSPAPWRSILSQALAFALAWLLVVGPWIVRNGVSVGKWELTEEYGSATLIERFAFDDMSAREFLLTFPYCLPAIGAPVVNRVFGPEVMARFVYYTPSSFFHVGRLHRDKLVEAHGRLDPLINDLIRDEMRQRGWRYLLVSLPLAWCGMWVGGLLGLVLVPLFACACIAALRRSKPLFLLYAAPAVVMLGLHAAVANHYTRYNLILIGPFSAGAAWIIARTTSSVMERRRSQAAEPYG